MEIGPEIEAGRHPHNHGHWIDYVLGCAAILISLISLYLGTQNAAHMERLVAANSYPDLSFSTSNSDGDGSDKVSFSITNNGVGPARIKTLELFYRDRPVATIHDFLTSALGEDAATMPRDQIKILTSPALGELLPPREKITLAVIPHVDSAPAVWSAANRARFRVRASICYCSLFNECFRRDSEEIEPVRVKLCKATQPVIFHETEPARYWQASAAH